MDGHGGCRDALSARHPATPHQYCQGLGRITWESEVLAAHHGMATQSMFLSGEPGRRNEEWARAHMAFHHRLIQACGNPLLLKICDRLSDAAELYRAWSGAAGSEVRRDVAGEHQALLDAALAHDTEHAVTLFQAHVDRTQEIVTELDFAAAFGAAPATTLS